MSTKAHDIHQLIAAISPETYCLPSRRREVRRLLDEGLKQNNPLGIRRAAELGELRPANDIALDPFQPRNPMDCPGLQHPLERHSFSYDCMEDSLEAFYFNLLDHLESQGWQVTKLVDQFSSAAGSGFSGDLSRRAMKSQQEAGRLLEASQELVGKMMRRVERIKELERQLVVLSMTGNPSLPNLRSAPNRSPHEAGEADSDEGDYPGAAPASKEEATARLELERRQLRGQMDLLRLYARWAQPWLRSGEELHERASHRADLVTAFNTTLLKVVLLARRELPLQEMIHDGELPKFFTNTPHRNYTPSLLIELRFRTAPKRITTGTHAHRGRVETILTSYALHDAEVAALQEELDRDGLGVLLGAVDAGSAAGAEATISAIERLLDPVQPITPARENDDENPFLALWSLIVDAGRWLVSIFRPEPVPDDLTPDRTHERVLRSEAALQSRRQCLEIFAAMKQVMDGLFGAP